MKEILFYLEIKTESVPLIPKADDDLNVTCLTQNGQTGLERLN